MKKIHISILLFAMLLFAGTTSAQQKAFQFGFKVAPSMGWIKPNTEEYDREGVKAGFNWGFVGEFFLMENYALATGFNVIYLNGAYTYPAYYRAGSTQVIGTNSRVLKAKYIQLPVILKMKTNDFNGIRFYGELGFGLGFKTDAKAEDKIYNGNVLVEENSGDVSKELRFTRESLILGAGVEYPLGGSTFITAGLRFDNNFIDILKDQNEVYPDIEQIGISNFIEFQLSLLF